MFVILRSGDISSYLSDTNSKNIFAKRMTKIYRLYNIVKQFLQKNTLTIYFSAIQYGVGYGSFSYPGV